MLNVLPKGITKSINEFVDFDLDFLGNIEDVFSTKKDSQLILKKGDHITSLIHSADIAKFELEKSSLRNYQNSNSFELRLKIEDFGDYVPVQVQVSRENMSYSVKMDRLEEQCKNRYDSSLFINLNEEEVEKREEGAEVAFCSSNLNSIEELEHAELSELLLPILLKSSSKENYIIAKKFPSVMMEAGKGEALMSKFFEWFFSKLYWFSGMKEYVIEGQVENDELRISLKYVGNSFMVHDAIVERPEVVNLYKELIHIVEQFNGTMLNASSFGGNAIVTLSLKYKVLR